MGYITDARTAIIAKAASVSGVRGASPRLPETISSSPWFVLGAHRATIEGGVSGRERTVFTFPLRLYVERMPDDDLVMMLGDNLIDATVDAFAQGVTLSGIGAGTSELRLVGWDADNWVELGADGRDSGTPYLMIEFTLILRVTRTRTYTA